MLPQTLRPALVLLLLALQALPAGAWEAAELERARRGEVVVSDPPGAEGGTLHALAWVAAPPERVRRVLWEAEKFPEFMPDAKSARILAGRGTDRQVVEQVGGKGALTVGYRAERRRTPEGVAWRALDGPLAVNEGEWRVSAAPPGSALAYRVRVVPKGPVPAFVVRYLQRQGLEAMIAAIRRRVEAPPT